MARIDYLYKNVKDKISTKKKIVHKHPKPLSYEEVIKRYEELCSH